MDVRMRKLAAYSNRAYKDASARYKSEWHQCWVTDENGRCTNRGTVADHVPPISTVPNPWEWNGQLLPQCKYHSNRQSGLMRHGKTYQPIATRQW